MARAAQERLGVRPVEFAGGHNPYAAAPGRVADLVVTAVGAGAAVGRRCHLAAAAGVERRSVPMGVAGTLRRDPATGCSCQPAAMRGHEPLALTTASGLQDAFVHVVPVQAVVPPMALVVFDGRVIVGVGDRVVVSCVVAGGRPADGGVAVGTGGPVTGGGVSVGGVRGGGVRVGGGDGRVGDGWVGDGRVGDG
jgi:hypothetical protein